MVGRRGAAFAPANVEAVTCSADQAGRASAVVGFFSARTPLSCWPCAAQAVADQLALCKTETHPAQLRIGACTRVIDGAADNNELKVEALLQRGVLYELGGEPEAAIADYSQVIVLDATSAIAHFNR